MSPEDLVLALFWSDSVRSLLALAIGFAVAGLLSSGYQLLTLPQYAQYIQRLMRKKDEGRLTPAGLEAAEALLKQFGVVLDA